MVALATGAAAVPAAGACQAHPWCNRALGPQQRAGLLLAAMRESEKLTLVASGAAGDARLGIPPLRGIDGPNGVGSDNQRVTAFPDAETLAASWDTNAARAYGQALGAEAAGKGYGLLFAPTVNIVRTPKWGREAETLGEDPFLTGAIVVPEVRGIQSARVIAQVKHFAGNNQEVDRIGNPLPVTAVSDQVSERALQEIYFPGFHAAVGPGHAGSVMCSYNRINTVYSCQNPATLGTLKRGFGFGGFVGPDALLAVRDEVFAANAGVDNFQLGSLATALSGGSELPNLTAAVNSGKISRARLDDMAKRILTAMFAVGLFEHPPAAGGAARTVSTAAHRRLATHVAEQATVLLRNRGAALPLGAGAGSIAVIGHDAGPGTQIEENGSPAVVHGPLTTPLQAIRHRAGSRHSVSYTEGTLGDVPLPVLPGRVLTPAGRPGHGLTATLFNGTALSGTPALTRVDPTIDFASKPAPLAPIPGTAGAHAGRWNGTLTPAATGTYRFSLTVSGAAKLFVGGHLIASGDAEFFTADIRGQAVGPDPGSLPITFQGLAQLTKGRPVTIAVEYSTASSIAGAKLALGWQPPDPGMLQRAVRAARRARTAVVFAGDVTGEGMDRTSLSLPGDQDRLIEAVARANPRTVVVLHTAGPVLMPWLRTVAAVVEAWYPGQQSGPAIASTLFGDTNPSGHLPVTFPASESQGPATRAAEYPGINNLANYDEGIFVGYRFYDHQGQRPLFPFGFGLSYTSFRLGRLRVQRRGRDRFSIRIPVTNTGRRAGAQVIQLYVGDPPSAGEPPRQLKAFARVFLQAGQTRTVLLPLEPGSFEVFDGRSGRFVLRPGSYRILAGTSSRDLPRAVGLVVR